MGTAIGCSCTSLAARAIWSSGNVTDCGRVISIGEPTSTKKCRLCRRRASEMVRPAATPTALPIIIPLGELLVIVMPPSEELFVV
jgi:hypothetical protein